MSSAYDSEEAFDAIMDDMQVLYRMRAGDVVSQADIDALNRLDTHWREDGERIVDAYSRGWGDGITHAAGADRLEIQNKLDAKTSELSVAKALSKFDVDRAFRRGAQQCREMMACFVEQGGGPTRGVHSMIAGSIRANWNPDWGEDPGRPNPCSPENGGWMGPALSAKAQAIIAETKGSK